MKEVKYIGIYDVVESSSAHRDFSLAAVKKMNYIIGAINRLGKSVQVVSIARNKKASQKVSVTNGILEKEENQLSPLIVPKSHLRLVLRWYYLY